MSRILGRGPWVEMRPTPLGKTYVGRWEEVQGRGCRKRSRSLGRLPNERAAWSKLGEVLAELNLVLPPSDAPEAGLSARGMRRGHVVNEEARRLREQARQRWTARVEVEAAMVERAPACLAAQRATNRQLAPARPTAQEAVVVAVHDNGPGRKQDRHTVGSWLRGPEFHGFLHREYEKSYRNRCSQLQHLVGLLGDDYLDELSEERIESYKQHRFLFGRGQGGKRVSPTTVRIELETLKIALKHARRLGYVDRVISWSRPRWRSERRRIAWTVDEVERALQVAHPPRQRGITRGRPPLPFSTDIELQILFGVDGLMRPGEILHLSWEDVDFDWEVPQIHVCSKPEVGWAVKTERDGDHPRDRWVPLSPRLLDALRIRWEELGKPRSGWLFPHRSDPSRPRTTFRGALARVCEHASVRVIRPVELRHTGATIASQHLGFTPDDLMAVGGWASPQIPYEVYVKRSTKAAARKMKRRAEGLEGPKEPVTVDRRGWKAMHARRGEEQ